MSIRGFLSLVVMLAAPSPARPSDVLEPPITRAPAPVGPELDRILGIYRTSESPVDRVTVESPARGLVQISQAPRWQAVGFFQKDEFYCVLRRTDSSGWGLRDSMYGLLRVVPQGGGVLEAWGEDPTGRTFHAMWSVDTLSMKTRGLWRTAPRNPARPGPDEYVYTDELPELINNAQPAYPDAARRARIEGKVLVQALVGTDGRVLETRVVSGPQELRAEAESAVRLYFFKPAIANNKPVAVWVTIPINFVLH